MNKETILQNLQQIQEELATQIKNASSEADLEQLRIQFLGKKGQITSVLKDMGKIDPKDRGEVGQKANEVKNAAQTGIEQQKQALADQVLNQIGETEWIDISAPGELKLKSHTPGHLHPLTQIQQEVEDIFRGMGFMILDGPEVETDYYNFTALNTPEDHPARDMQDTFWTQDGNLLRTHTSAIQIRGMEKMEPPFKVIGPGRVFRYETVDASHENTFYQVEGMMVGKDISVANLIFIMKEFLKEIFQREVKVRLRPGYFPFVEPGFELDINCLICGGKGCSVCKHSGWLELLPCGLVHPQVLKYGNIDTDKYSGFAFGLGLNRLVMMRYGIDDIRWFQNGDLRFVRQF